MYRLARVQYAALVLREVRQMIASGAFCRRRRDRAVNARCCYF